MGAPNDMVTSLRRIKKSFIVICQALRWPREPTGRRFSTKEANASLPCFTGPSLLTLLREICKTLWPAARIRDGLTARLVIMLLVDHRMCAPDQESAPPLERWRQPLLCRIFLSRER